MAPAPKRQQLVIDVLEEAFAPLMKADPVAFRGKYRKMAGDPFAFYRGTACLFDHDLAKRRDPWADERTGRVWIHGDLHVENFGTYMNSHGELIFDVNDFDEAYLGPFSWDLRRFLASLALMGWQKALPEEAIRGLSQVYLEAYLGQVHGYVDGTADGEFALRLDNTTGVVNDVLRQARLSSRIDMLDGVSEIVDDERRFRDGPGVRRLPKAEFGSVMAAFRRYLTTIPENKRVVRDLFYDVKDIVGSSGFGIGSAGLPAYNLLLEGYDQALENDVVLSMKQANVPALSRVIDIAEAQDYFEHEGHRTTISQRSLQVHSDPFLGYTTLKGVGYVVDELSPYESDLVWDDINEPEDMEGLLRDLGRATAKIHCASDADSDESLVRFQTEYAIADALEGREGEFVADLVDFCIAYAGRVRKDHALFVDAFREGRIGGVTATRI